MTDIEIERSVDFGIVEFHQYVVAGNTELGAAKGDKSGGVEAAHPDQVEPGLARAKPQLPGRRIVKGGLRLDAYTAQHRHHFAEDPAVRQRHDQAIFAHRTEFDGHTRSSGSWHGCHGVGQGSPRSRAWQRTRATSSRIEAPLENSSRTAPSSCRIASNDRMRPSSLRRKPV